MSRSSRVLVLLLTVALGLGTWLALRGGGAPPAREAEGERAGALANGAGAELEGDAAGASATRDGASMREAHAAEEAEPAPPAFEPYTTSALRGTLTLTDEFGNGPFMESGTFGFWLWEGEDAVYHEVVVEAGRWETVLPPGVRLTLGEVELGGRTCAFPANPGPPFAVPVGGWLDLEAFVPERQVLRVLGTDTSAELDGVTVVHRRGPKLVGDHPGEFGAESLVVEDGASPVELRPPAGVSITKPIRYFVRARGYAWSSLTVDHARGGTHEVWLQPAGGLEVALSEFDASLAPVFRLWRWGEPALERPLEWRREFTVEGVAPGEYLASVDIGADWRHLRRLGETAVTVVAGGVTRVVLDLEDGPEYARCTLTGVVVVPSEWELPSFRILARLLDEVAPAHELLRVASSVEIANVEGRPDAWRFSFPDVVAGLWQIGVEPTMYSRSFEIGPDVETEIEVRVPPPADWIVRTVDPHTDEPARVAEVAYTTPMSYTSLERLAEPTGAPGVFRIRVPLGPVVLKTRSQDHLRVVRRESLRERTGELTLEVAGRCGVRVRLLARGEPVALGSEWRVRVQDATGSRTSAQRGRGEDAVTFPHLAPGDWTVTLEGPEEQLASSTQQVSVRPNEIVDVTFEL